MDRQILNITANEQILTCDNPIKISTNKVNYIEARFDLGQNWSGYDSVRAVWFNDFNCISTVLDSLGNCVVPFEVMKRKGNVKVNLVGSISEDDVLTDRLTSYPVVAVIVDCTAQITGANTSPVTPSEYEQFVAAVHEDAERAEAGATASEQSAQNAHTSEQNASQSAQSAHDDKIAIEEAIAEVIQQIEDFEQVQVVVNTLPPSSQATSDFTDGVLTLGIPQGVKGDTGNGIQSIRKTSTSGLVDTYTITYTDGQTTTFTVTNGAKGDTGNGITSIEKTSTEGLVDTYTITYTDGTTTTFTVTNGEKGDKGDPGEVTTEQLEDALTIQTLSDNAPYNYRRTNNGNGSGTREYDEIIGASVGWNQLVNITGGTQTDRGITATLGSDGVIALSGTSTGSYSALFSSFNAIKDHVYLALTDIIANPNNVTINVRPLNINWGNGNMKKSAESITTGVGLKDFSANTDLTGIKLRAIITDLTLALGSTIADYVYTLEQSTAGSGVTWLKSHFPKLFDNGYMSYDSGSIKSVSGLTAHEMVGVNVWDEEWEVGRYDTTTGNPVASTSQIRCKNFIHVMPNTDYYVKGTSNTALWIQFYDKDKNIIYRATTDSNAESENGYSLRYRNKVMSLNSECHYIKFYLENSYGATYKNDICINLSDTSINGQYFPYEKHTYPLDSSVELRGQYKLNNGQLYAVGDVWSSDGTVNRNYYECVLDGTISSGGSFLARTNTSRVLFNYSGLPVAMKPNSTANTWIVSDFPTYAPDYTYSNDVEGISENKNAISYGLWVSIANSKLSEQSVAGIHAYLREHPITVVYPRQTPTTETATPYTSPQWCDSKGTEEYVGSELPVGHNTQYPMSLVDTMDGLGNGSYTPKLTITNGVKTITWQSV